MKILDLYIFKKFITAFFFGIGIFVLLAVVFDYSEKVEDFQHEDLNLRIIVFTYYLNFIPYFINLLSPLFIFISVIFFTANLAAKSEIVAMLAGGMSFYRLLVPYMAAAIVLAFMSYLLASWILPPANKQRVAFEDRYVRRNMNNNSRDIHIQIAEGQIVYVESFSVTDTVGYRFSLENFDGLELKSKIFSDRIKWVDSTKSWRLETYYIRYIDSLEERIVDGYTLDTIIPNLVPQDFNKPIHDISLMNNRELRAYIDSEKRKGKGNIEKLQVELQRRYATPFSTLILTLIGVALSSRKVRGGIGLQIGIGITLSFLYIVMLQFTTTFAINSNLSPFLALWIPNILFGALAVYLIKIAPK